MIDDTTKAFNYGPDKPELFLEDDDNTIRTKIDGYIKEGLQRLEESITEEEAASPSFAPHINIRICFDVQDLSRTGLEAVHNRCAFALRMALEALPAFNARLVDLEFYSVVGSIVTGNATLGFRISLTKAKYYPKITAVVADALEEFRAQCSAPGGEAGPPQGFTPPYGSDIH